MKGVDVLLGVKPSTTPFLRRRPPAAVAGSGMPSTCSGRRKDARWWLEPGQGVSVAVQADGFVLHAELDGHLSPLLSRIDDARRIFAHRARPRAFGARPVFAAKRARRAHRFARGFFPPRVWLKKNVHVPLYRILRRGFPAPLEHRSGSGSLGKKCSWAWPFLPVRKNLLRLSHASRACTA